MNKVIYDQISDIAITMHRCHKYIDMVSAIAPYHIAKSLITELSKLNIPIGSIVIFDSDYSGYDKEFQVTIMDDMLYCGPIFARKKDGYRHDRYLDTCGDIVLIHQDCNSAMLKHIDSNIKYEFAVRSIDDM